MKYLFPTIFLQTDTSGHPFLYPPYPKIPTGVEPNTSLPKAWRDLGYLRMAKGHQVDFISSHILCLGTPEDIKTPYVKYFLSMEPRFQLGQWHIRWIVSVMALSSTSCMSNALWAHRHAGRGGGQGGCGWSSWRHSNQTLSTTLSPVHLTELNGE